MAKKNRGLLRKDRKIEANKLSAKDRITEEVLVDVKDVHKSFRVYFDKGSMLKEHFVNPNRSKYENREILKGISFQIHRGETVALIGNNGCGKSTTLKMLTKILYPNKGTVSVKGKVSSLIELGAGFHPDMSGRENIYINASILGLSKEQIDERVEEIIRFSELEEFIDNPIRTYSSGMYMRLAFSVAINVDADILLIDEILAVGDQAFQEKCINKLTELRKGGTTVVLVSHAMGQVNAIADRCIWIDQGKIVEDGLTSRVCRHYEQEMERRRVNRDKQEEELRQNELAIEENENESQGNQTDITKQLNTKNENRNFSLALVIAMLCIILGNAVKEIYGLEYVGSKVIFPPLSWNMKLAAYPLMILGRLGFPSILVILGYQLFSKKLDDWKNIKNYYSRVVLPVIMVWECAVLLYQIYKKLVLHIQINVRQWILEGLCKRDIPFFQTKYISALLICICLVPILRYILKKLGNGKYMIIMSICWIFLFLFPGLDMIGQASGGVKSFHTYNWLEGYILYFCLGYYFYLNKNVKHRIKKELISFVGIYVGSCFMQIFLQKNDVGYLLKENYFLISIMVVLLIDIFSSIDLGKIVNKYAAMIAENVIGIFCIYPFIQYGLARWLNYHIWGLFAIKVIASTVVTYVISTVVIIGIRIVTLQVQNKIQFSKQETCLK